MEAVLTRAPEKGTRYRMDRRVFSLEEQEILTKIMAKPVCCVRDRRFSRAKQMKAVMDKEVTAVIGMQLPEEDLRVLFMQLNYARYRINSIRRTILRQGRATKTQYRLILNWHKKQLGIREKIITTNMGLVLAMVKYTHYSGVEMTDLISEGSVALLRAVDKFDCARGFKFSTYACRAILRSFSRVAKKWYRYRSVFPLQLDLTLEKDDKVERSRTEIQKDLIEEVQTIYRANLAELSGTEQSVMAMRFSLQQPHAGPLTLQQVGKRLGLSKERIRQIQNKALTKLRLITEERAMP